MTTIDVVIPTLNAAARLNRTLAALQAPDHRVDLSITVSDGGSSDDSVAIARGAGATVVTGVANRGAQLAAGAAIGDGQWLLFLHADTVPGNGWARAVTGFTSRPANVGKAGYLRLRFDTSDPRARRIERLVRWRSSALGLPYGDQGLLIARTLYEYLGGYRPMALMEDVDLVRRIGRKNLVPLDVDAVTSPQRYERDGWLARPLRNLSCLTLFFIGFPTPLIRRLYDR